MDKTDLWLAVLNQVSSGIGALLGPQRVKNTDIAKAEAKRRELLLMEKTRIDIDDVRAGKKAINEKGEIVPIEAAKTELDFPSLSVWEIDKSKYFASLVNSSQQEARLQQIERTLNLRQIAIYTDDVMETEAKTEQSADSKSKTVDPDWFTKWRNNAQDASNEELQKLWARILAGEIKLPGTFSVATLNFLSRLSKADAELIEKFSAYVLDGNFIYGYENGDEYTLYNQEKVTLDNFIELEELGFISGVGGLYGTTYKSTFTDRYVSFIHHYTYAIMFEGDDPKQEFQVVSCPLTKVGREVIRLTPQRSNVRFLENLAKQIKTQNSWLLVSLGEVTGNEKGIPKLVNSKNI
jgi:Protein of unknown function (DUF2806)